MFQVFGFSAKKNGALKRHAEQYHGRLAFSLIFYNFSLSSNQLYEHDSHAVTQVLFLSIIIYFTFP
jgi:hypothetical protein